MYGLPVVSLGEVAAQIKEKGIQAVFIADDALSNEQRDSIRKAADGLEVKDYTGYLSNLSGSMPVTSILEVAEGPVTLMMDGHARKFDSGREALSTLTQRYEVRRIISPTVEIEKEKTDMSWIDEHQKETGEEVSFF